MKTETARDFNYTAVILLLIGVVVVSVLGILLFTKSENDQQVSGEENANGLEVTISINNSAIVNNGDGSYRVPYTIIITNTSAYPVYEVQVNSNLANALVNDLGQQLDFDVISVTTNGFILNPNSNFNGSSNTNLLSTDARFETNQSASLSLEINLYPDGFQGPFGIDVNVSGIIDGPEEEGSNTGGAAAGATDGDADEPEPDPIPEPDPEPIPEPDPNPEPGIDGDSGEPDPEPIPEPEPDPIPAPDPIDEDEEEEDDEETNQNSRSSNDSITSDSDSASFILNFGSGDGSTSSNNGNDSNVGIPDFDEEDDSSIDYNDSETADNSDSSSNQNNQIDEQDNSVNTETSQNNTTTPPIPTLPNTAGGGGKGVR